MSDLTVIDGSTGEVLTGAEVLPDLDDLASAVRREYRRSREALGEAVDAYFAVGHALLEARRQLPSNDAFGAWFNAQEFGFSRVWAHTLRTAAEHEPQVRVAIVSQLTNGRAPNIEKAVKQATAAPGDRTDPEPAKSARRSSLPDAANKAGWELRRAVERVERVIADDRFTANKEQVATQLRSHLTYVAEAMPGLLDVITTTPNQEDQ